jgi:Raf kinase inhibitor-like YbhB/YbcL family protein
MIGLLRDWTLFPMYTMMLLPVLTMIAIYPALAKEVRSMSQMTMTSPVFVHTKAIPGKFSCDGDDLNPPLAIEGVPKEAKSLALVMDDPDAPAGVWVHWVLWNIDPTTTRIGEGSVPPGAEQGVNSWGRRDYGGPCPPSGTHRYFFRLFALKERLDLPASATRKDLDRAMQGKIVARCELFGLYSRK